MSLHKQFRRDKSTAWLAVTDTIEVECVYCDPSSPEYTAAMTRHVAPVRKLAERKLLPPAKDRELAVRTFVEVCLVGWRTVMSPGVYRPEIEVKDGEWLPFNMENAVRVFTDYPPFYSDVTELARDLANFQNVSEEDRKN